mgnify:CR=1 FL=1
MIKSDQYDKWEGHDLFKLVHKCVLPIDPNEYENKMSMGMGQKMLVKVVQVAEDYEE